MQNQSQKKDKSSSRRVVVCSLSFLSFFLLFFVMYFLSMSNTKFIPGTTTSVMTTSMTMTTSVTGAVPRSFPRVFQIGFNKCGTRTLAQIATQLGLESAHYAVHLNEQQHVYIQHIQSERRKRHAVVTATSTKQTTTHWLLNEICNVFGFVKIHSRNQGVQS